MSTDLALSILHKRYERLYIRLFGEGRYEKSDATASLFS